MTQFVRWIISYIYVGVESEGSSVVDVLEPRVGSQQEWRCIALQ